MSAACGVDAAANPFRASRILEFRYRFVDSGWDALLSKLEALGMRAPSSAPRAAARRRSSRISENGYGGAAAA